MKAILVKRLPATDTKPSRWKVQAEGVPHLTIGTYNATAREAACILCEKYDWGKDLIEGDLPNGDKVFVFAPKHRIGKLEEHPADSRHLQFAGTSNTFAFFANQDDAEKVLRLVNGSGEVAP